MLNNVAEAVKIFWSAVCSHVLTSWQILLNPRRGWGEQDIMGLEDRLDRVRSTVT